MATAVAGCAITATQMMPVAETADRPLGDAARGRDIITGRDGNCLLCHAVKETGAPFMGNLGPPLDGIGARSSEAELRLRIEDPQRFNPDSIMPSYARTEGLVQVGKAWRGKPILNAQQIEDTVAFLATLR
jgi:L-cysteine S-thiosulfotransferase